MRLAYLYLRSRQVERALVLLALLGAAALLWRRLSDGDPLNSDLMVTGLPVAAAVIIGASTGSPFRDVEDTARHWLPALRLPHLAGLVTLAAGALALTAAAWHVADIQWALARNLILFSGLALLGARLVGPGLGWLLPVGYGFLAFLATLLAAEQPHHQLQWAKSDVRWAWSLHAGKEHEAALVASLVLVISLGIVAQWGARDRLEETV
jgi:hypothetical protein